MVLVDSSVWIAHFKKADLKLVALLEKDRVLIHSLVLSELYLGRPKNKDFIFERLEKLPRAPDVGYPEIKHFIDQRHLTNKGIGIVDTMLLASAFLSNAEIYTFDKKLNNLAKTIL